MKIKKGTIKDINTIADIEWKSGYKWNKNKEECIKLAKRLFDEGYCDIYILYIKEPAGYFAMAFNKNKKVCYINYFAIKKQYQGKGLSKIMIKKAIDISKKSKCKEIELAVWNKNFPAISLYNKFGFFVFDIKRDKYPNGDNKLKMRKEII